MPQTQPLLSTYLLSHERYLLLLDLPAGLAGHQLLPEGGSPLGLPVEAAALRLLPFARQNQRRRKVGELRDGPSKVLFRRIAFTLGCLFLAV